MTARTNFADRLLDGIERKGTAAVVGLDPRYDWIPSSIREEAARGRPEPLGAAAEALRLFCRRVIDLVGPFVVAVKPQIAFFEEYASAGLGAYADVVGYAREKGLIVIGDIKRSDIASTADAYARAHLGGETGGAPPLRADAVTVNPYLGSDGVRPFLEAAGRVGGGLFVLCRTSNPSAGEFQDLSVDVPGAAAARLHEVVARSIAAWGEDLRGGRGVSSVGAVVGVTRDGDTSARIRELLPRSMILVPGFGAQGGGEEDLPALFHTDGSGAIVNSSRGVIFAYREQGGSEESWEAAVEAAARDLKDAVNRARDAARSRS